MRPAISITAAEESDFPVGAITAFTALYALIYLVWERAGWGSPAIRDLVGNVAFMPLNLLVASLSFMASQHRVLDPGVRRGLRLFSLGSLCVLVGNCISTYYLIALGENPPVSWADAFYLSDSFLMLAALLAFPSARRIHLERWKFVLDAAMVLVGGGVLIWFFTVRPTSALQGDSVGHTVLTFAYPLANLLVLLGITTVILRGPLDGNKRAFALLCLGVSVSIIADLTFDLVMAQTGERSAAWTDAVYLLTYLLMIAGAELYWRSPIPRLERFGGEKAKPQPLSPLPYFAVATTYALLLGAALAPWSDPMSGIALGAVFMTVLVVSRQLLAVSQNVRLLNETANRQNEARFRSLVQHSSDVILLIKPDLTIHYVSPSVLRVLRYDPADLTSRALIDFVHSDDRETARKFLSETLAASGTSRAVEWRFRAPDGSATHVETIATNLLDDPTVGGLVLNTRDVSERKRLEKELKRQAFHDPLTGLPNRALFRDRVSHALTLAQRQGNSISVLFLDLDDFKKVNDSLGHAEGDRLLVAASERFHGCARAADTVARFGGDEFAILLEDHGTLEGPALLVDRLTAAMARPFILGGNEVTVNASIGVATAQGDETADDLLRNADMAMYTAKRHGKGRSETYQAHMYSDVKHRVEMETALRSAVEREELSLVYQPIFSLRTGKMEGVEALLRWEHPQFGALLPQHFIPLAEETGLIVKVGRWVLREACRQVQIWRTMRPESPLSVAVNISGRQLNELDIVTETRQALADTGVDPSAVCLEITESVLMQETGSVLERLQELKALGVRLAIDDFGTGYSSLSYLQRFPIDMIKIAKPFVEDVGSGLEKSALARAIIGLGETLKLSTVAEGVERAQQCSALIELGCDLGQGYYFAAPLPPAGIGTLLAEPRMVLPPTGPRDLFVAAGASS